MASITEGLPVLILLTVLHIHAQAPGGIASGTLGREQRVAQFRERRGYLATFRFVAVGDGEQNGAFARERKTGGGHGLEQRGREVHVYAHHLAGRLHLRAEKRIDSRQLGHREDGGLDRDEVGTRKQPALVAEIAQGLAEHHVGREPNHGHAR